MVVWHRLIDAAMKIRAKLLIPLEGVYFLPWRVKPRFMKTNARIEPPRTSRIKHPSLADESRAVRGRLE